MHLLALHEHGSSNPLGVSGNTDRLPFHPYFTFKDLVTLFVFLLTLSLIVFFAPNLLGHSDNYIPANPMQTPPSIEDSYSSIGYYLMLTIPLAPHPLKDGTNIDIDNTKDPIVPGSNLDVSMIEQDVDSDSDPDHKLTGVVRVGNLLVQMTLTELQSLVAEQLLISDSTFSSWSSDTRATFQEIANGVMQADGHIGGAFPSSGTVTLRPIWFISQNASKGSILFFTLLHAALVNLGIVGLSYSYSITSAGNWHIRMYSRD